MTESPAPTAARASTGLHTAFIKHRVPDWLHRLGPDDLKTLGNGVLAGLDGADLRAAWLTQAREDQRKDMLDCIAASVASSHALAQSLKGLQGITEFAQPLLEQALQERFGTATDVNQNRLYHLGAAAPNIDQSLLQAALLNFESDTDFDQVSLQETSAIAPAGALLREKDGPPKYSFPLNKTYQPYRYRYTCKSSIKPADFADLCRTLDLGKRYQEHLDQVFDGDNRDRVHEQMKRARNDLMAVHARRARMKGYISEDVFALLQGLLKGERPRYNGHALAFTELELFGSAIGEVFVIGCATRVVGLPVADWQTKVAEAFLPFNPRPLLGASLSADEQKVIVYMPGAGQYEWGEYSSILEFEKTLAVALRSTSMQNVFIQWVKHDERQTFQRRLKAQRYGKRWNSNGFYEQIDNPEPDLSLKETWLSERLFDALHERHQTRMRDNARLLAVPTAVVDNEAMWARLKHYAEIGLDVLNVAAFFVPVLGHVMLAVTAVQLSVAVYQGFEAWSVGDRAQAWAHFESVALNVGFAAALMGAGAAARIVPKVQVSKWVGGLVPVKLPNGQARLWKPDIEPYRSDIQLDPAQSPNASGQYEVDGRTYARLGEHLYEQTYDAELKVWRIKHPNDPDAYQPELEHNQAGAWRHRHEQPLQWDRLTLLRRMGHANRGLDDEALRQIGEVSGVHDDALRKMHMDRTLPPPALAETLRQFQVERDVNALAEQIRSGSCVQGLCEYEAPLSVKMPGWPEGHVLEVFQGEQLQGASQRYGAALTASDTKRPIRITRGEIMQGQMANRVLSALDERQVAELLGTDASMSAGQREQRFRDRLARVAGERKKALFDSLYRRQARPDPDIDRLQRHFPGLARAAARDVLERAPVDELAQLRANGRIPLRMASEIRVHVQQGALNRALAGLYLENMASAASDRLALHSLPHLPDWPADLRVEVRSDTINGALLDSIGSEQASVRKILVKKNQGFQVFDAVGRALNGKPSHGRNLFESLAAALPPGSENLGTGDAAPLLQRRLAGYACAHREEMARLLKQRPIGTGRGPSLRLPSGRLGYLASGRGEGFADALLVNRARMIYPNLTDPQARTFINDLLRMGRSDQQVMHLLNNRQRESDALGTVLLDWVQSGPEPQHYGSSSRRFMAERIMAGWREGFSREAGPVAALDLRGAGRLPHWAADFSHVRTLSLSSEQLLGEAGNDLLGRFPQARRLNVEVRDEHLPALCRRLETLSTITELSLETPDGLDASDLSRSLQNLSQLEALWLAGWNQALDVSRLTRLRTLQVRGAMSTWPAGALDLPRLETLDLQGTRLNTLPEQLFEGHERVWRALQFEWSSLEPPMFAKVYDHLSSHLPHQFAPVRMLENYCQARLQPLIPGDVQFAGAVLVQLKSEGLAGHALLARVDQLHREGASFVRQLNEWQAKVVRVDRRVADVHTRKRAADKLLACWRRSLRTRYAPSAPIAGPSWRTPIADEILDLAGGPLGDLPVLPKVSFEHIRVLDLTGARLAADDLNAFLEPFPNLRQLNLNDNRMTQLPAALDSMSQLEQLFLSRNELTITASLQRRLNRLASLKMLGFSYNRVETLNLSSMAALEVVDLSHSAIRTWPEGALELARLRRLDLSHSAITDVPEAVFSGHEPLLAGLQLRGCRLNASSMEALQRFAERSGLATPVGIARQRLLAGSTGGDPEFFPAEVADEPDLLLPLPLEPLGTDSRLTSATRLQSLDPQLSDAEAVRRIESLGEQGLGALEIEARLTAWQQEHRALVSRLNAWIDMRAYREGAQWISAVDRRRAADRILRSWCETLQAAPQAGQSQLDLSGLNCADLPELPIAFDHVGVLDVSAIRLTAHGSNGFFRSFKRLERLAIRGNELDTLPESLFECERLTHLEAGQNDLRDNTSLQLQLRKLVRLEWLDLSDNTLGEFDLTGLEHLKGLDLRGNVLGEWPEGVFQSPSLTTLNLSNNQIESIPVDALLPAHARLMAGIDLADNLLQEADLWRMRDYLEGTGQGLGFSMEEIDRLLEAYEVSSGSTDSSTEDQAISGVESVAEQKKRWFVDVPDGSEKHQVWDALVAEDNSQDFFGVLSQLRHTEDFKRTRADLVQRVWRILHSAHDNQALRETLFSLSNTSRGLETCGDGRMLLFNDLEIKVGEFNALKNIEPQHRGRELLKLSKGLFRLGKVEEIARADSQRRPRIDSAEIRLAYRIGLTQRLGLPQQPKAMTYANLAQVTDQALDEAFDAVIAAEKTPAFTEELINRPYWMDYLRERYTAEFSELSQRFAEKSEALDDQFPAFDGAHAAAMTAMGLEHSAESRQLAVRLSTTELAQNQLS